MTKFMLDSESVRSAVEDKNPMKRVGTTEDMAGTVLYLVSRAGSFTNGANIVVDGGAYLHEGFVSSNM